MEDNQKTVSISVNGSIFCTSKIISGLLFAFIICTATSLWCGDTQGAQGVSDSFEEEFNFLLDDTLYRDGVDKKKSVFVPMLSPLREDFDCDEVQFIAGTGIAVGNAVTVAHGTVAVQENEDKDSERRKRIGRSDGAPAAKRARIDVPVRERARIDVPVAKRARGNVGAAKATCIICRQVSSKRGSRQIKCNFSGCDFKTFYSDLAEVHRKIHTDEILRCVFFPKCLYAAICSCGTEGHYARMHAGKP